MQGARVLVASAALAVAGALARAEDPAAAARFFADVTEAAGLAGKPGAFPAWNDFDADGRPDLFAGRRLYRNGGPPSFGFVDVTDAAFGGSPGAGVWADLDNNGFPDLAVPGPDGADPLVAAKVWLNDGRGKFKAVPVKGKTPERDFAYVRTIGVADFDFDAFADLFLVCSEDWNNGQPRYYRCFLFRNSKGKEFKDVSFEAGVSGYAPRYARGVAFGDYNNDGCPDAYVSNYRLDDNALWENQGDGTFRNVAGARGVRGTPRRSQGTGREWFGHTIGSGWGDLDNDGNLDLWTSNLVHKDGEQGYHRGYICDDSKIYRNRGAPDFSFEDVREKTGIPPLPLDGIGQLPDGKATIVDELWAGVALGDFDNDGLQDAFVPQVYDLPWAFAKLYRNKGGFAFEDATAASGIRVFDSYSGAWADFDEDGDLDLATWGRPEVGKPGRLMLYRNGAAKGRALLVRLRGREGNGSALGARCTLRFENELMIREAEGATSSHNQQNSPILHFGLGERAPGVLEVRWPTGRITILPGPKPGPAAVLVEEPGGRFGVIPAVAVEPAEPKAGEVVSFKAEIKVPASSRLQGFAWDFDMDNRFEEATEKGEAKHVFANAGTTLVRVRMLESKTSAAEKVVKIEVK